MTDNMGSKEFGLWRELPASINTAWGCRAILNSRYARNQRHVYVDLPYDRQSCYGVKNDRDALIRLLNKGGQGKNAIQRAFKEAEKLTKKYEMDGGCDQTFTLYQKNGITVLGNTNASHGYLYVIAWADSHLVEAEVKKENKRLENKRKKAQRELNRKKRELRAMFLEGSSLTRVCVESPIYGTTPEIAKAQYGITPDVIFLRDDDWSLGAPMQFADESDNLWCGTWVGFVTRNDDVEYVSPYGTRDSIAEIQNKE